MATTINAATTGLVETSDGTAVLDLQTGGTTALRVNASQAIGVGSSPSFGTSGQVLTSQGNAASPTWTTVSGSPGGTTTQVQYNSSGSFAGSANLTFDGTTLTAAGFSGPHNGTVGAATPAAGTFTTAKAIAAATQDSVLLQGRAGGTSSYVATITPTTLTASRTLTLPDSTATLGYLNAPPVGNKTASYTLAVGDVGKYVQLGASGAIVIPTSTFSDGDLVTIYNNTSSTATITCSAPTAYIAGSNTVVTSVTLAIRGVCTVLFSSATTCVLTGNVS
jgi:hypothetical protein